MAKVLGFVPNFLSSMSCAWFAHSSKEYSHSTISFDTIHVLVRMNLRPKYRSLESILKNSNDAGIDLEIQYISASEINRPGVF